MKNYVIVPGLMGSELIADRFIVNQTVWLSYTSLASDGVPLLRLDATGTRPAGDITLKGWKLGQALADYYGPLISRAAQLGPTMVFPYDWRLSILSSAELLAGTIQRVFPTGNVRIIGHSLGGLIARAAMEILRLRGDDAITKKLVTLGTPHYGSWSTLAAFARFSSTYLRLAGLVSALRGLNPIAAFRVIDPVVCSFPSVYELLTFAGVGPLATQPALAAALYSSASYRLFNPNVSQVRLDAAKEVQVFLAKAGDPARTVSMQGTGSFTISGVSDVRFIGFPTGYKYSWAGDSTVSNECSSWAGAGVQSFAGVEHQELPRNPIVLAAALDAASA